jgi:hypothetical protein
MDHEWHEFGWASDGEEAEELYQFSSVTCESMTTSPANDA